MVGRPREFEDLVHTAVTINRSLLDKAKELNINISEVCRNALAIEINDPKIIRKIKRQRKIKEKFKKVPRTLRQKIDKLVGEDPGRAKIWANIVNKRCNLQLTRNDILNYVTR